MAINFPYKQGVVNIAMSLPGYYVWDTSVIKAEDGYYYMFSSRWPSNLGFGWNWLLNSEIILTRSKQPEGPYQFVKVVLPRRGKNYFDGMNTHNTCIKHYDGKYYLYYMGTTYDFDPSSVNPLDCNETYRNVWKEKRIGLAYSEKIDGDYKRLDTPLLNARPGKWDATAITNPTVVIKDNGETFMLYKSRSEMDESLPMRLGIAHASSPLGKYERMSDDPVCKFTNRDMSIEDPYIWFDKNKNKFCALMKDCNFDGSGVTKEYGSLFYAESDDCMNFTIYEKDAVVATRNVVWKDGHTSKQANIERPCLLFDEDGHPTHLFCASGDGPAPFNFTGETYIVCIKLNRE